MKSVALLYHDVIEDGRFADSGFSGEDADIYKLDRLQFQQHLDVLARLEAKLLITVDDGGISALHHIAPMLEQYGRRGMFFVATDFIGRQGFLSEAQIRELHGRGHILGSHSCSHPSRMSHLSWEEMCREWRQSVDTLAGIVGEEILTGSVPGGFYSRRVAEAAGKAGIRTLFTSEPVATAHAVGNCVVVGRFGIQRTTTAANASALVQRTGFARTKQRLSWEIKKGVKRIGGTAWLRFRRWALAGVYAGWIRRAGRRSGASEWHT